MGGISWGSWTALQTSQTINASSNLVAGSIDNNGKIATEISVECTYNASATKGAHIQVERDKDGANFEGISSAPWSPPMPFTANTTRERVITVGADRVGKCQIRIVNDDTVQQLTGVTVRYRQATTA